MSKIRDKIKVTVEYTIEFEDGDAEGESVLGDIFAVIHNPKSFSWQPDGWRVWGVKRLADVQRV